MLSQLEVGLVFRLFASGWSFLNFAHSGYANNYTNFILTTFFLEVYARWFVRFFLTDFYQYVLVCLFYFRHHHFFHHVPNFDAVSLSEKVNEVVPFL